MIPQSCERDVALNYLEPDKAAELREALGELRDGIIASGASELLAPWSRLAVLAECIRRMNPEVPPSE